MFSIEFEIYRLPKRFNSQQGKLWVMNWKHMRLWRGLVGRATDSRRPEAPLLKARLTLIRKSSREPDYDGLVHSFKHVIDALKYWGIILDDRISNIGRPEYSWQKAKMKQGKIFVRVEEL